MKLSITEKVHRHFIKIKKKFIGLSAKLIFEQTLILKSMSNNKYETNEISKKTEQRLFNVQVVNPIFEQVLTKCLTKTCLGKIHPLLCAEHMCYIAALELGKQVHDRW